jgi:hypothetical protein
MQEFAGTRISYDKREFVERVQAAFDGGQPLVDGYAPFCKHVFVPNFVGAAVGALPITDGNRHLLQSGGCRSAAAPPPQTDWAALLHTAS